MSTIVLVMIAAVVLAVAALVLLARTGDVVDALDPETDTWRPTDAEVVSVLRASNRTFLLVHYLVGSQLVRIDVMYPLAGDVPQSGQRIPIRYDPASPAHAVFDIRRGSGTPPKAVASSG